MILFAAIVPPMSALEQVEAALGAADTGSLALRPLADVNLPIARFGNTTLNDANRLVDELGTAATEWDAVTVSFGGGSVVDTPSERILGVHLRGEVDALARLSMEVKAAAQRRRFLLDRRDFHPVLTLATVRTGAPGGVDAAAAALQAFHGEPWPVTEVSVRKQTYGHEGGSEGLASIPLRTS